MSFAQYFNGHCYRKVTQRNTNMERCHPNEKRTEESEMKRVRMENRETERKRQDCLGIVIVTCY